MMSAVDYASEELLALQFLVLLSTSKQPDELAEAIFAA
jgi:hypothetical protein